ncbi:MAG: alpha/beta hydrolase [Propionibacteriaceae bacterium]
MNLNGRPLFVLIAAATVVVPILAAILWRQRHGRRGKSWLSMARRLCVILVCQLLAVAAAFLWVNASYGFYTSWSDLTGGTSGATARIVPNGGTIAGAPTGTRTRTGRQRLTTTRAKSPTAQTQPTTTSTGAGTMESLMVAAGPGTNGSHQVKVWLPPQYQSAAAGERFPVVMVLPGQPSTPTAMFTHYRFGDVASAAIASGRVAPFVAVFPPLMTAPPRDTECTDVPGGPQAETWLSSDVYRGVKHSGLRINDRPWSVLGWSTGAFCAMKLVLHHPAQYQAVASLGGYYRPLTDSTTGDLFHGSATVANNNSPTWLYQHGGLHHRRLLLVVGRQDRESFVSTAAFLAVSRGDAGVSSLTFPVGGHNYHNYRNQLPTILGWLSPA